MTFVEASANGNHKTAAFGIPIIERFGPSDRNIQALILLPTRSWHYKFCEELKAIEE
ncbi:MAG: hypothetical protein IPN93_13545 [Bacteroidetes bacterium]|nr:hypothetical protein [Bacteroidota bacterium]